MFRKHALRLGELRCKEFQADEPEAAPQFLRRRYLSNSARMDQRDPMAAFGFVEIRCGDENCQPLCREVGQRVPKLAPRDWINTGGRLIQSRGASFGTR